MATMEYLYICLCVFKMLSPIENPADCEIRAVAQFPNAKGMKAVVIHSQFVKYTHKTVKRMFMTRNGVGDSQ